MAHRQQDLHESTQPLTTATSLSWPLSILNGLLTGIAGMLAAGVIAAGCVEWYSISSFEGKSGFFVVGIALLGLIAGGVIGIVVARMVAAGTDPGFLKALGRSLAVVAAIAVLSGGTARLLADVPPELDGETLMLAVEVRWPPEQVDRPAAGAGAPSLTLYSLPFYSNTARAWEAGPLWIDDARQVDGRWVAPGAVSIFTSRGKRMLVVSTDGDASRPGEGFLVPLPGRPGKRDLAWSEWLPRSRPGVEPFNKLTYRFRVLPVSQPVRTEAIGAWEVDTRASGFYHQEVDGRPTYGSNATFALRHEGRGVAFAGDTSVRLDGIALLVGKEPAFIALTSDSAGEGTNYLVSALDSVVRVVEVGHGYGTQGELLTNDSARFSLARGRDVANGQLDRSTYAQPGLYLLGDAVVDTRNRTVHPFSPDTTTVSIPSAPPPGLSPDERSFVSYANEGYPSDAHVLVVTNFVDNVTYTLPVEAAGIAQPELDAVDPAWLARYFAWRTTPGKADRLVARQHQDSKGPR